MPPRMIIRELTAIAKMAIFDIFEVLRSVLFLTQYVEAPLTLWILRYLDTS